MYLGSSENRPNGPAKLKKILEKKEGILNKWRNGTKFCKAFIFPFKIMLYWSILNCICLFRFIKKFRKVFSLYFMTI